MLYQKIYTLFIFCKTGTCDVCKKLRGGGRLLRMSRIVCIHTYDDIISVENLLLAWREFKRGKTQKIDVQEFEARLMENILLLHRNLAQKVYVHGWYEAFTISDPKRRDIHKASV